MLGLKCSMDSSGLEKETESHTYMTVRRQDPYEDHQHGASNELKSQLCSTLSIPKNEDASVHQVSQIISI